MADNEFRDIVMSDSDDDDFNSFDPVDINNAEFNELGDLENVKLNDDDHQQVLHELEREERDIVF